MALPSTHSHLLFQATTIRQRYLSGASSAGTNQIRIYPNSHTMGHEAHMTRDHHSTLSIRRVHTLAQLNHRHQKRCTTATQQTYLYHRKVAIMWIRRVNSWRKRSMGGGIEESTDGESTVNPTQIAGYDDEMSQVRRDLCCSSADHPLGER
jgi:hypothetical protein